MKMRHPESAQEIDVAANRVAMYASQGWIQAKGDLPPGNGSLEVWRDYALANGHTEADIEGFSRDDLRNLFTT